ncbi:hypothetical protein H4R35_003074 [Dimargaris xerosporica]|nr:hypothetical protein H4R35_003074 [Dimargaris xerosporica]
MNNDSPHALPNPVDAERPVVSATPIPTATPMNGLAGPTGQDSATAPPTTTSTAAQAKEMNLAEFLLTMDENQPLIPDAVTDYYLERTGFECDDVRIKRLLALVAQKFIADIATDAFQYSRVRQMNTKERKYTKKDRRTALTMDDLTQALQEYGVNIRKPQYYA